MKASGAAKNVLNIFQGKGELYVICKVVLSETRIIISQSLRQQVLAIAHDGHVGIREIKLDVTWPFVKRQR